MNYISAHTQSLQDRTVEYSSDDSLEDRLFEQSVLKDKSQTVQTDLLPQAQTDVLSTKYVRGPSTWREMVRDILLKSKRPLSGREIAESVYRKKLVSNPEQDRREIVKVIGVMLTRFRDKPIDFTHRLSVVDGNDRGQSYCLQRLKEGEKPYPPLRKKRK